LANDYEPRNDRQLALSADWAWYDDHKATPGYYLFRGIRVVQGPYETERLALAHYKTLENSTGIKIRYQGPK
jgi:hypothetical protein